MSTQPNTSKNENFIYDVGLRRGQDTDFYPKNGYQVVVFEADPESPVFCRVRFAKFRAITERLVRSLLKSQSNPQVACSSVTLR